MVNLTPSNLGDPIWYVAAVEESTPLYYTAIIIRVAGSQDVEIFVVPPQYTEIAPYITTAMVFDSGDYVGACRLRN